MNAIKIGCAHLCVLLLAACSPSDEAPPVTTTSAGGSSATTGAGGESGTGGSGGSATTGTGGSTNADTVAMFVAQGHVGMTVVSCDDGKSWTGLRTFETEQSPLVCGLSDPVSCFSGECSFLNSQQACETVSQDCDCDHHPGAGKGLAFGDGAFVATFGWGQPGVVLRSENGFDWTEIDSGHTFADVAAGKGLIVLSERTPHVSSDGGLTFAESTDAEHVPWNVRRLFYFPDSEIFMQTAASGPDRDVRLTSDFASFSSPSDIPYDCTNIVEAIEAASRIVTRPSSDSYICLSSDGGDTFARVDLPNAPSLFSGPIHDGSQFLVWGLSQSSIKAYTSADGTSWTEAATNLESGNRFGEVARNPTTGTMVAARSEWQNWYAQMRWYRSSDGFTWETLSPENGVASHPVRELTFGWAAPSAACPLPE